MKSLFNIFTLLIFISYGAASQTTTYKYDSLNRLSQVIYPDSSIIVKYTYDAVGNRISKNVTLNTVSRICSQSNVSFIAGINDSTKTYQWQLNNGNGYGNIFNNSVYSGASTDTLILTSAPSPYYGYYYRCMISDNTSSTFSPPVVLKFSSLWTGAIDTLWTNPGNWNCAAVPDSNTDVTVLIGKARYPTVTTDVFCRSLNIQPGAAVKVKAGFNVNIIGKN